MRSCGCARDNRWWPPRRSFLAFRCRTTNLLIPLEDKSTRSLLGRIGFMESIHWPAAPKSCKLIGQGGYEVKAIRWQSNDERGVAGRRLAGSQRAATDRCVRVPA